QRGQSFPRPDHPDTSPATGRWAFSSSLATSRLLPGPTPGLFARSLPLFKVTVNLHPKGEPRLVMSYLPVVRLALLEVARDGKVANRSSTTAVVMLKTGCFFEGGLLD